MLKISLPICNSGLKLSIVFKVIGFSLFCVSCFGLFILSYLIRCHEITPYLIWELKEVIGTRQYERFHCFQELESFLCDGMAIVSFPKWSGCRMNWRNLTMTSVWDSVTSICPVWHALVEASMGVAGMPWRAGVCSGSRNWASTERT